jgi:zinc/manganese transport system permease protein
VTPSLSLNPLSDVQELVRFQFMVNALWAGAIVAVLAAVAGYLMILRRQAFAGHSLAVMAFPGATGAALVGLPTTLGYYLACGAAALAMAAGRMGGRRVGSETATIGTVQTVGLAAGFLFLSLNAELLGGPESLLFGTFLGVTSGQVLGLALVAAGCLGAMAAMGRPLLFSSVDPAGARAAGAPVRLLDLGFVLVLGLVVAATSQITGALLVFALLVAPPATAALFTARPLAGLAASALLALAIVWLSLALAYYSPYPVGFYVSSLGFGVYLLVRGQRALRGLRARRARLATAGTEMG